MSWTGSIIVFNLFFTLEFNFRFWFFLFLIIFLVSTTLSSWFFFLGCAICFLYCFIILLSCFCTSYWKLWWCWSIFNNREWSCLTKILRGHPNFSEKSYRRRFVMWWKIHENQLWMRFRAISHFSIFCSKPQSHAELKF